MNRIFNRGQHVTMIDRAQRLKARAGSGNEAVLTACLGGVQQTAKQLCAEPRHVASYHEVPIRFGYAQSRVDSSQGTEALDRVGNNGNSRKGVSLRRAYQNHAAGSVPDALGNLLNQCFAACIDGQKRFIPAHPSAAAACQNETASAQSRRAHEMMVTIDSGIEREGPIALKSKKVYLCSKPGFNLGSLLVFAMLAASPMRATDSATATKPAAVRTVVVRVDPRTRKLVRHVVVTAPAQKPPAAPELSSLVERSSRAHDVDPLLVDSIIRVESNYNAYAVSPKGAEGLMQLMPPTARMLGVSNSFDPGENIEAGVKYLKSLQDLYKDDRLALAAYNAGPGAVDKYQRIPPYPETQRYVESVGKRYVQARQSAEAKPAAPPTEETVSPPVANATQEEKYAKLQQFVDEYGRLHLATAP